MYLLAYEMLKAWNQWQCSRNVHSENFLLKLTKTLQRKDKRFQSVAENIHGDSRKCCTRKQEKTKNLMSLCQKDTMALWKAFQLVKDS